MVEIDFERLKKLSDKLIDNISLTYKREYYHSIHFEARLVLLKGFRGVGKTTLLMQYAKENYPIDKTIFLTLDHIHFSDNKLLYTVDDLYDKGMRYFILDEVHKYENWSQELKNIYDSYPDIRVMATSSSALEINKGKYDLSRRADIYELKGLSFREYLKYNYDIDIPIHELEDIIKNKNEIHDAYFDKYDLKRKFNKYLKEGYYPYFKDAGKKYYDRMLSTINLVIETDLPAIFNIDYDSTRLIKKLLSVISRIAPFTPNISNLARDTKINRTSILNFLDFLESADLITLLKSGRKSDSVLTKPDKILLENTNLLHMLSADVNVGTQRETFAVNALKNKHKITTPKSGDLIIDMMYTAEIGGPNKSFKQLKDVANPLLIIDTYGYTGERTIPLWMLGLL